MKKIRVVIDLWIEDDCNFKDDFSLRNEIQSSAFSQGSMEIVRVEEQEEE